MSLFSLSRAKVAAYKNDPSPVKRRIYFLLDNYNRTLVSIILCNMFANSCISMLNDTLIRDTGLSGVAATAVSAFAGIVVLLLFGEITPMTLAYVYCDKWSKVVAYPVSVMRIVLFPVIYVAEKFSNFILDFLGRRNSKPLTLEEYESYIETCARNGAFSETGKQLLKETLDFSTREVSEIMQDRTSLGFLHSGCSAEEVENAIFEFKKMYFLIGRSGFDDADRILSAKDFFAIPPDQRVHWERMDCVRNALFIPGQTSIILALRTLKKHEESAALVSDEYGGVAGLISLSGIYSALTGASIEGEKSAPTEPLAEDVEKRIWCYDGRTPIDSVLDDTGWVPSEELESSTLNGVFCELFGSIPKKGAVLETNGIRIRVLETNGNRASLLEVERLIPENREDE